MKWQTGAARLVEALRHEGVRCVFGLPGTQTLELFEELRRSDLRTVIATNELSAAFMAGGWARVTGEPGVLITIAGPGFTWALTGVAEARLDSIPLLHITAALPQSAGTEWKFRQQELAQAAIASPLVKGVIEADSYSDPGVAVIEGLALARSGEPGPVLLQISPTVLSEGREMAPLSVTRQHRSETAAFDAVRSRFAAARRPVLLVGRGASQSAEKLRAFAELLVAPVVTFPSARGLLPESHELNFGFDPFAGRIRELNELLEASDLVVVVGSKLGHSDTSGFELKLPPDRLVHVDSSDEVLGANYPASLRAVGDADDLFTLLLNSSARSSAWDSTELEGWRSRLRSVASAGAEPRIAGTESGEPRSFFESLGRALPADAILVLDSGLHQILARRYHQVLAPNGLQMPTDLQSMGFAIPTAIGARLAVPLRPVVALLGDGGFAMTALELLSAVRERISLVVIVFVDGAFGQIRLQQIESYGATHGVSLSNPDFNLLATSLGARYESVGSSQDIESVTRAALNRAGVTVIEVKVGDTFPIRRLAAVSRAREATRRALGRRVSLFLTNVLRRAKGVGALRRFSE